MRDTIYADGNLQHPVVEDETPVIRKYLEKEPLDNLRRFSVRIGETGNLVSTRDYLELTDPEATVQIWERNQFDVEAVRVSEQNIRKAAEWAGGECARTLNHNPRNYVLVDTAQSSRLRQSKVFVGDWIVRVNGQLKHYKNTTIGLVYHRKVDKAARLRELFEQALSIDIDTSNITWEDLADRFTVAAMAIVEGQEDE
jgi:hypothetical protein